MIFLDDIHLLTPDQGESDSSRGQTNPAGHDDTGVVVLAATNVPWQLNGLMKARCTLLPLLYLADHQTYLSIDSDSKYIPHYLALKLDNTCSSFSLTKN
jgi:hypothetical protein